MMSAKRQAFPRTSSEPNSEPSSNPTTPFRPARHAWLLSITRSHAVIAASLLLAIGLVTWGLRSPSLATAIPQIIKFTDQTKAPVPVLPYVYAIKSDPAQTTVTDQKGVWLATFTNGSSTVRLAGARRVFAEPGATVATVTHNNWVRVLPKPFTGTVDEPWLSMELADTSPDVLAIAMQYTGKAPAIMSNDLQIAGDASYGPPTGTGSRKAGADFNDYLAIDWRYGTKIDRPEPIQNKSLDCSGYIRMVWGYRSGLPLAPAVSHTATIGTNEAIPRRAAQQHNASPGVVLISDKGTQVTDLTKLAVGDIVFFDANKTDGLRIDHVGMFLGNDSDGHYRFLSSRKTADGPTMGDVGGKSVLDGSGFYGKAFRAARRF